MSINTNYETLCSRLSDVPCSDEELKILKDSYSSVVNSKRRLNAITTVAELLKVLQKRDYINPDKTEVLLTIASLFKNFQLEPIQNHNLKNHVRTTDTQRQVIPRLPNDPKERVYKVIATDIGQKWMDLARALGVPEGYIDELHLKKNISDRVYEILSFHENNHVNSRFWRSSLMEALTDARRNDLRKKVQNIFDTYSP